MNSGKLEICCYTAESAIIAEQSGADRIELCDNFNEGGTTPSIGTIRTVLQKVNIPVNIIIRPRGGDFLYSDVEYEIIKHDVKMAKELGVNGVVVGFLNADGEIDFARTAEIVKLASPMEVTFHRAFDMCKDQLEALEQLIGLGVKRILTSGCKNTAIEGQELLTQLVDQANNRIIIMPGSGVNDKNIAQLIRSTRAIEYHSSAKIFIKSEMKYFNPDISMGGNGDIDESSKISVNPQQIRQMADIIKNHNF